MTQSKHTQGPWNVAKPNCGLGIFDTNRKSIAAISSNQSRSWEEKEANARLIAAAPDLLEALEALEYEASQEDINTPLNIAILKARKAIAKAKGVGV